MKVAEPGPVASAGHLPPWRERVHALCVLLASILVRLCVGLLPYSGHACPPRYGDYEAQRHWMEVTLHLPASEWYRNSTSNPMDWWGLDYPPLSAYQSWLYGQVLHAAEPESVALLASHGYESPGSKRLMRWTVVASELAFFAPPALAAAATFTAGGHTRHQAAQRLWLLFCLLLQPAALLIDHAHFQYNHISLGLALGGAAAVAADCDILGSVLFTLSLHHKQMNMYYGPAFFAHLLGKCLRSGGGLPAKAAAVARLGLAVLATFAMVWAPLGLGFGQAGSPSFQSAGILAAAKRLVPIQRGLFEDYVGNVWCLLHVAGLKLKHRLATGTLLKLCSSCTLLAAAPAMVHQMLRPSRAGLLYCMACTASAFFLFSFQVHEKSILLPLLPVTALAAREPTLARWMPLLAAFSMFPLLKKDGAVLAYAALLPTYWLVSSAFLPPAAPAGSQTISRSVSSHWSLPRFLLRLLTTVAEEVVTAMGLAGADFVTDAVPLLSLLGMATLHAAAVLLPPPPSLPFLYDAAITSYACLHFVAIYVYLTLRLWSLPKTAR